MVEAQQIKLNLPKFENKKLLYLLGLIPIFFIALYIRTRNLGLLQGKYLIELDSYFFFRYSKMLFEQGSVPAIDFMRYVPVGHQTESLLFFPKTMVFFYKIAHAIFPNLSQIEWHIIYPPVITVISLVFFFLFIKELFGYKTAFFSTAFLAVIPAYLQRTGAGFADHEAVAMLWMFLSLWLFVLAWKSGNLKKLLPLTALSGIFAGMMAGTWGGYLFLSSGVSLFVVAYAVLNPDFDRKYFLQFLVWA
ncbi:MAG TPA: STT3 domain-containing protein, partial [Candidatus Nanoarchaeia archaeon]|nr:STT3 domain-containing protein [Candidatus Nanoarchaeia archaeon]